MFHEIPGDPDTAARLHRVTVVDETMDSGAEPPVAAEAVATNPAISNDWDRARHWLNAAIRFDECKLWCQVMLGFELLAIRPKYFSRAGRPSGNSSQIGTNSFDDVLVQELGIPRTTAYRFMQMAEAAKPRLKKLPELNGWDPTLQPLAALPAPQAEALKAGVRKLTDGQTQLEFLEALGLAKKPQGSAAKGGNLGGKKPEATPSDEAMRKAAREDWSLAGEKLFNLRASYTMLADPEVEALISYLDRLSAGMKRWVRTPAAGRNPALVSELTQSLSS